MFRLQERQLNMILVMLGIASVILFCLFAWPPHRDTSFQMENVTDFSEAWICNYRTNDSDKIEQVYGKVEEGKNKIREVVMLPAKIPVMVGTELVMNNKLPDFSTDQIYLMLETRQQAIEVYVGNDCIYKSGDKENKITAYHFVPIPIRYRNKSVTIKVISSVGKGLSKEKSSMNVSSIFYGTYGQIISTAVKENGIYAVVGMLLGILGIFSIALWRFIRNKGYQKKILLYTGLESVGIGVQFIFESRLLQVLTRWNESLYFMRACLILLVGMLHILLVRAFIYKKKIQVLFDMGILFYGICYISFMVLQGFSLMQFETIYLVGKIILGLTVVIYTIVLMIAVYDYRRKEGRIVLVGNAFLLVAMLLQFISYLMNKQEAIQAIYPVAFAVYLTSSMFYGLYKAVGVQQQVDHKKEWQDALRAELLEQINPNLLFASFSTLQKMIKNGSENSIKMIYYMSVYFRDNLRAIHNVDEFILFEEELEHMIAYLQLQKTRNHTLNFAVECKEKKFKVPRHCIVPLVENAVKYGVSGKENTGNIVIRSYMREDGYAVQVIDDGIGFETESLTRGSETSLLCIIERLKRDCNAQTEIISKIGKGTVITIVIPMLENELIDEV